LLFEAYGPGASAILIEALSDSRNRTVQEIKTILKENSGKWAESGSVQWAFEKSPDGWTAKFPQDVSEEEKGKLLKLLEALDDNNDVQEVYTNINFGN
jgi:transcriptional/translational regulatory protein YebC/TACO1